MRIAIVNDTQMTVEVLRRITIEESDHEVAWIAYDGAEAVKKCEQDLPDLILMDLIMPVMNGVEATRQIMSKWSCPILIVTATVEGNAGMVFETMGYGALDAVCTPALGKNNTLEGSRALLNKIATIEKLTGNGPSSKKRAKSLSRTTMPPLVVIGSSTGGPNALVKVLSPLPRNFPAGIVIVQHVDKEFAHGLVEWLNSQIELTVRVAREGDRIKPSTALVTATNDHLILRPTLDLAYTPEPKNYPYRPSVDTFFTSVEKHWPTKVVGVLLTGIGRDGAKGLLSLRSSDCYTIAQNEESCTVYGMPKAAVEIGAAQDVLAADEIGEALIRYFDKKLKLMP